MAIVLNSRHRKTLDRRPGAEVVLPWPANFRAPTHLDADEECDATPGQVAYAYGKMAEAIDAHDLVILGVVAAKLAKPTHDNRPAREPEVRLVVHAVTRRWAAKVAGAPGLCWIDDARPATTTPDAATPPAPPVHPEPPVQAAPLVTTAAPSDKPTPRRTGYTRLRPSKGRTSQLVWAALRKGRSRSTADLAAEADTTREYAYKLIARWRREELVESGEPEDGHSGTTPTYRLANDLGPIAPILIGSVITGQGYTDPNNKT